MKHMQNKYKNVKGWSLSFNPCNTHVFTRHLLDALGFMSYQRSTIIGALFELVDDYQKYSIDVTFRRDKKTFSKLVLYSYFGQQFSTRESPEIVSYIRLIFDKTANI